MIHLERAFPSSTKNTNLNIPDLNGHSFFSPILKKLTFFRLY